MMEYYSVTTCLQPFFPAGIPRHLLDRASERGTIVHAACSNYATGIPVMGLRDDLWGYFQSFVTWFDNFVDEVLFVEQRMVDEAMRYNGKPDLGCKLIDGRHMIVDMKTPIAEANTWKLQIAGYVNLARIAYPDIEWAGGMSLRLKPNGSAAKATVYSNDQRDYAVFLSALNVYRYIT
ncbi:MAG: hypothetical protein GY841_12355 [FCB group bacterium]|nr:hypothetical protein [FCB group bacterium]